MFQVLDEEDMLPKKLALIKHTSQLEVSQVFICYSEMLSALVLFLFFDSDYLHYTTSSSIICICTAACDEEPQDETGSCVLVNKLLNLINKKSIFYSNTLVTY